MKKKNSLAILSLVLGLVLITVGTTYSLFSYNGEGVTESTIITGGITFHYKEINGKGRGINIENAYPISDEEGKSQSNYFDFRITSESQFAQIPYTVTLYAEGDLDLASAVKVYLTEINNNEESQLVLSKYNELANATFTTKSEKVLYSDTVPVDGNSYEKNYRLRMWIDNESNFGGNMATKYYCGEEEVSRETTCSNGKSPEIRHIQTSPYNNKSFSVRVNVYTNEGQTLTNENITSPDDTRLQMLTANNTYLSNESDDDGVDLELNVPNEVNSINLNTTLQNIRATDSITPLGQTLSYIDIPSIRRISTSQEYALLTGNNYFKITVTSADTTKVKDYILKVTREKEHDNNLTYLAIENYAFNEEFDSNTTNYTVSVEESSINIIGNKSSQTANITGLGEKTLTWGENTFTITVTAEDGTPKDYTITVNNVLPTAPSITGGTNGIETSLDQTISILSPGTAISGVDHYEYYKSTSSTAPTSSTTGTQLASPYTLLVSDQGTSYIWYRTVSSKGNKSSWSNVQQVNINKIFEVQMTGSNITFSNNKVNVEYGSTNTVTVTPSTNYYISGGSCTNDYTITDLTTGTSATGAQTITINNNNKTIGSTCTFTTAKVPGEFKRMILANNTLKTSTPNFNEKYPSISSYSESAEWGSRGWRNLSSLTSNYYTYASSYTFNSSTGTYTLKNTQVCQFSSCYQSLVGKYIVPPDSGSTSSTPLSATNLSVLYKVADSTSTSILINVKGKTPNYDTSKSGLYKMVTSNGYGGTGTETYYFRGEVTNNVVEFAGFIWRIIRINEDGTIRLILDTSTDTSTYCFNNNDNNYMYMYYSGASNIGDSAYPNANYALTQWYNTNIDKYINGSSGPKYSDYVATGNYFCEAAKVKYYSSTAGNATPVIYSSYTPTLDCNKDGNDKQYVYGSIGLITYEEFVLAGGKTGYDNANSRFYLYLNASGESNNFAWWTMSPESYPMGTSANHADVWHVYSSGGLYSSSNDVAYKARLRPVINLRADVNVTKDTTTGHYIVQ